jgi:hypothetical protein
LDATIGRRRARCRRRGEREFPLLPTSNAALIPWGRVRKSNGDVSTTPAAISTVARGADCSITFRRSRLFPTGRGRSSRAASSRCRRSPGEWPRALRPCCIDEPTEGLSPLLVRTLVAQTHEQGRRDDSAGRAEPRRRAGTSDIVDPGRDVRREGTTKAMRDRTPPGVVSMAATTRSIQCGAIRPFPIGLMKARCATSPLSATAARRFGGSSPKSLPNSVVRKVRGRPAFE